jgi:hypothetical protein
VLTLVVVLTGGLAAGSSSASPGKHHSPGIPASARAALRSAAIGIATRHGDSHPYDIEAVRTTHRKAERLLCGDCEFLLVPPSAPVYVVAMRGHFNCNLCSHPRGRHFSPAGVITLQFLNPSDLRNVAFGYGGPYPHLRTAGTRVRL